MVEFFDALLAHRFLQNAVLGGILASIGCGIMGSFVVVKRIGLLAGGIAHAVLAGMGAAYFYQVDPLQGALLAAVLAAIIIGWVKLNFRQNEDTIIAALWAAGMAVGVLFVSKTDGYNVDLMSYLFGNILLISERDLYLIAILDTVVLTVVALFYKQFLAIAFDEEFAKLRGVPVALFYILMLIMVALTVVMLIQIVGLILVIALLTLPAAIASQFFKRLSTIIIVAIGLAMFFTQAGLVASFSPDLPAGSVIVLIAAGTYVVSLVLSSFWNPKAH